MSAPMPEHVEKAIGSLCEFHRKGTESLAERTVAKGRDGLAYLRKASERLGTSDEQLRSARLFAMQYDHRQLERLCRAIKRKRCGFSATHMLCALRVRDRERHEKIVTDAVEGRWTIRQLKDVRRSRYASAGYRGPFVGTGDNRSPDDERPRPCRHSFLAR